MCSYFKCKKGNCKAKDTCLTHNFSSSLFEWILFKRMLKAANQNEKRTIGRSSNVTKV